jgi:hypothetical protein
MKVGLHSKIPASIGDLYVTLADEVLQARLGEKGFPPPSANSQRSCRAFDPDRTVPIPTAEPNEVLSFLRQLSILRSVRFTCWPPGRELPISISTPP